MSDKIYNEAFNIANNIQLSLPDRIKELIFYYKYKKGYGDQRQELEFFKHFFHQVFKIYPECIAFEWNQYQDYNDNYLYFDLELCKINYSIEVHTEGFDDLQHDATWDYSFDDETYWKSKNETIESSKIYDAIQHKYNYLRPVTDIIMAFLKACYDFYKPYYFIYLFGRRANVKITRQGISINAENINYLNGDYHDKQLIVD